MRTFLQAASSVAVAALLAVLLLPTTALAQATGILDIQCNVEGAMVLLDGEVVGQTPFLEIVPAGVHTVTIERDGFDDFEQKIEIGIDTSVELVARLARVAPALTVTVDVDEALVTLDGVQIGKGRRVTKDPATAGRHELRVEADGYGVWSAKVTLKPGTVTPVDVELRGSLGAIAVHSNPEGSAVFLDGKDYGLTPTTIDPASPGTHGLRLSFRGLSDVLQAVIVDPGKAVTVDVGLVEAGGTIEVKPSVSEAQVFVNGVEVGVGKVEVGPVKPGTYSVRATAADHTDSLSSVIVEDGKRAVVVARLEPFAFSKGNRMTGGPPGGTPVAKRPGFWAAIGGGVGAAVAIGVIAGVASRPGDPVSNPGVVPPSTDATFTLP